MGHGPFFQLKQKNTKSYHQLYNYPEGMISYISVLMKKTYPFVKKVVFIGLIAFLFLACLTLQAASKIVADNILKTFFIYFQRK